GVSVQFPYYEFRFEEAVQAAVGEALNIPRTVFDGTQMFPYAPSQRLARFEEPAVFVTGIRHAERVADFSAAAGATHVYTGHGGDQLFCTDLTAREQMVTTLPSCAPFSRAAWRAMKAAIAQTR